VRFNAYGALFHFKRLPPLIPVFREAFAEFEHGEFGKIFVING
jgi:hypothetical protein